MINVGFITSQELANLTEDDRVAAQVAGEFNFQVQPIIWNQTNVEQLKCQVLVIRSPWDYVQKYEAFRQWLEKIKTKSEIKLFNPTNSVIWNLDKKYLYDLSDCGVPIVPTHFVNFDQITSICKTEPSIDYWVVKPVVSASAWRTHSFRPSAGDLEKIKDEYTDHETLILQPLVDSVRSEGEYSLIYFNGVYSHTVVKRSGSQDFRVQVSAKVDAFMATEEMLNVGDRTMAYFSTAPLYARVDLVRWRGHFHLMELEIAEPSLYFKQAPTSTKMFWQALQARL